MTRHLSTAAVIIALGVFSVPSRSEAAPDGRPKTEESPCLKGSEAAKLRSNDLFEAVKVALSGPQCGSVVRVLSDLQSKRVAGGRKLHDKPFDRAAAQKELQAARADAEFVAKLGPALQGISDANARKVVEAAVLEDLGFFGARQLLVDELMQTQGAR